LFELIGFLAILTGGGACFANGAAGAAVIVIGFLVFLFGRFF
jgi:hypothetical protein